MLCGYTPCNIYSLNFETRNGGSGTAVISAKTPNEAFDILVNKGRLNSTQDEYILMDCMLVMQNTSRYAYDSIITEKLVEPADNGTLVLDVYTKTETHRVIDNQIDITVGNINALLATI